MTTQERIEAVLQSMERLPQAIVLCEAVALAQIESGEAWWPAGWFTESSDYQRARNQVIRTLAVAHAQMSWIRRSALSPDLIRADTRARRMLACCLECPLANARNLKSQQTFVCLTKQKGGKDALAPMRIALDSQGQIHERR
jgi:hypothetical protein